MSTILKIIIAALVLVLVGSGIWWITTLTPAGSVPLSQESNNATSQQDQNTATNQQTQQSQQPTTSINSSSNTDASINSDFNSIDAEINGMTSDADAVDQSLIQ